jgi:2-polyprenyl-6-methoxyphenol hydroxylase-like FAD-dependent oxidoreductase
MAGIVVVGGGICGMAAAMVLARDGHDVTVIERDPAGVPESPDAAWEWNRRSVAQFRMPHVMLSRGHGVMRQELPDAVDRLVAGGGLVMKDHPSDERFTTVTGRRTTIEWALAATALETKGVEIYRGAAVAGLLTGPSVIAGVPHVTGVRLADGEELAADLVVDASGRRSPTADWIAAIGGRPPAEEAEDFGFTYTGRFLRSSDGSLPALPGPILNPVGSISLLCIPADNGTWSTTVYSASSDRPLRRLRDPVVFEKVVRECDGYAPWLDGEPISDMVSMSGVVDRMRHFVVDGVPVVTGMLSIADAQACTNPSIGRGMTLGLMHSMVMRDTVRGHLDDLGELALAFDAATRSELDPWHEATRSFDRARIAEMTALIDGRPPEPDATGGVAAALFAAATVDEQAATWLLEIFGCWATPTEVFSRDGALAHVLEVASDLPPPPQIGPDRQRLLELVS